MPIHSEFLIPTCEPDLLIVVTDHIGNFNLVDSWLVCEVRQIDLLCENVYGPFPTLMLAIERAQQAAHEIYLIQSAMPDEWENL